MMQVGQRVCTAPANIAEHAVHSLNGDTVGTAVGNRSVARLPLGSCIAGPILQEKLNLFALKGPVKRGPVIFVGW